MKNKIYDIISKSEFNSGISSGYDAIGQNSNVAKYISNGDDGGKIYLGNAFSLQMVAENAVITVQECTVEHIPACAESIIGHADTANVISSLLGREVPMQRKSIMLNDGDILYVAQVMGGRLPEGVTTLPEGFTIAFRKVVVRS